jgi:hypothetical protein
MAEVAAAGAALNKPIRNVISGLAILYRPASGSYRQAKLSRPGEVAQLVEHTTENRGVAGSIPALAIPR